MDQFKMEVANQVGVDYSQAYKGNIAPRDNGYVGGMTKKVWEQYRTVLRHGNWFPLRNQVKFGLSRSKSLKLKGGAY